MSVRVWFIVIAIVLAVGGTIAAIVVFSDGESPSQKAAEGVQIEFRATPTATISVDGRKVGSTPMSLHYPRSTRQIVVKASIIRHLQRIGREKDSKDELYEETRTVTLDRDQTIDFKIEKKNLVPAPD